MSETTKLTATQRRENEVKRLAEEAFVDHEIMLESRDGDHATWRCGKPNCGIYAFRVTVIPGHLIVTGDLGVLVVSRTSDMISWARGLFAVQSISRKKYRLV